MLIIESFQPVSVVPTKVHDQNILSCLSVEALKSVHFTDGGGVVDALVLPVQGIFHFQLGRGDPMLHTRLRPHCKAFLEKIAKLYELHVFTFGSRLYAHTIAGNGLS